MPYWCWATSPNTAPSPNIAKPAGNWDVSTSLVWRDHALAASPDTPTVIAMHHPPLLTGSPAWDRLALDASSRHRLSGTLERHPQVTQILGAHLHRPLIAPFASHTVLIAPSTYVQFPRHATAIELSPTDEPPGFVAHQISNDGRLISYFHTVTFPANDDRK
jgi:3',5'-cyclic-AMP phosphodiesterase